VSGRADYLAADYLDQLATFASGFAAAELPPAVCIRSKWILADCLAVIAAGMRPPEMRAFTSAHLQSQAPGSAWVIGAGLTSNALGAAFLNGIAGTWHELDEGNTLSKGHPGIQVVPAALAMAQETQISGRALLAAIAIGYEVSSRINRAGHIRPSIHPHGTFGVIGAALAAARVCGLPASSYRQLINVAAGLPLASSYNSIIDGATVRNVFTGHSAFMGINAVRLVQAGFTGEHDAVRMTYGTVLAEGFDTDVAVADLGREWMTSGGYFKLQPVARSIHPAIDATEDALAKVRGGRLDAGRIAAIRVRTYRLAAYKNQKDIQTAFGAKFSIPFAIATRIVNNRATLDCFDDAAVANPSIQTLLRQIEVAEDPSMTAAYPELQPCSVQIELTDGTQFAGRCDVVRGEPSKPNVLEEIQEKFMDLTVPLWGESLAARLFDDCMAFDEIADVALWSQSYVL